MTTIPNITIVETDVGKAVQVTRDIDPGQVLYSFIGKILDTPNMHTVQLSDTKHVLCEGGPENTAHSCNPNAKMVFDDASMNSVKLVSMQPIKCGALVSFNYCSTEWDMASPFPCLCGSPQCFGEIRGYKHLNEEQRSKLQGTLSPYLLSKIEKAGVKRARATSMPNITVVETDVGKAVQATQNVEKGQELFSFVGRVLEKPNMFTVQLSETKHLECEGGPEFTAHSCDPNSKMVFGETAAASTKLVATRAIKKGELITFNYCSTEWDMANSFQCNCGSTNCFGEIKGYKYCNEEQRKELEGSLAPYLKIKAGGSKKDQ